MKRGNITVKFGFNWVYLVTAIFFVLATNICVRKALAQDAGTLAKPCWPIGVRDSQGICHLTQIGADLANQEYKGEESNASDQATVSKWLSQFYSSVIDANNSAVGVASTVATFGKPQLIYGPWKKEDTDQLISVIGDATRTTQAIELGYNVGELLARLTIVKNDQTLAEKDKYYVEAFLVARFSCEQAGAKAFAGAGFDIPGGEEVACVKLDSAFGDSTYSYVHQLDQNASLINGINTLIHSVGGGGK